MRPLLVFALLLFVTLASAAAEVVGVNCRQAVGPSHDGQELLQRAQQWASNLSQELPNYVCTQLTTRYTLESKKHRWRANDFVSAELTYVDEREEYTNISVDGRKTNRKMMEIPGTDSIGEYATALCDLFSDRTHAQFLQSERFKPNGTKQVVYDFEVARPNSHWLIFEGDRRIVPAYSGSIWIDSETAHVLRVATQVDQFPPDFPLRQVETLVEYARVSIGSSTYLLPARAEALVCQRDSSFCSKNVIEFSNYHKYETVSTIRYAK